MDQLTQSPLCHSFCRKCKDEKDLRHDLPKQLRPFICEWHLGIFVETLKKEVNALKEVNEFVVVCDDISRGLSG